MYKITTSGLESQLAHGESLCTFILELSPRPLAFPWRRQRISDSAVIHMELRAILKALWVSESGVIVYLLFEDDLTNSAEDLQLRGVCGKVLSAGLVCQCTVLGLPVTVYQVPFLAGVLQSLHRGWVSTAVMCTEDLWASGSCCPSAKLGAVEDSQWIFKMDSVLLYAASLLVFESFSI